MAKWRPEGWKLPSSQTTPLTEEGCRQLAVIDNAYEAGANAMLESLKKEGKYIDASKFPYGLVLNKIPPIQKLTREFKGWVILIPGDEES